MLLRDLIINFSVVTAALVAPITRAQDSCPNGVLSLQIISPGATQETSFASAIVLDKERWIFLTPAHVIGDAERVLVATSVDIKVSIFALDKTNDIALLAPKTEEDALKLALGSWGKKVVALKPAEHSKKFGPALTCSHPLQTFKVERVNIIEPASVAPSALDKYRFIRIDKEILPGESGGAVIDSENRLIGMMITVVSRDGKPIYPGAVIPIETINAIASPALRATAYQTAPSAHP